jgi:superfamily I DNA/RNA helicase
LWRYERALEDAGLPFSSQAGKNLFRRQEVQDLVALVRALADSRDTLALGALLRGPLVGLTALCRLCTRLYDVGSNTSSFRTSASSRLSVTLSSSTSPSA